MSNNENCIEWLNGQDKVTVTFCQGKYINRIKKLAERFPEEVSYVENTDGSICGNIPLAWIRISKPREVSEEQRKAAAERLSEYWQKS